MSYAVAGTPFTVQRTGLRGAAAGVGSCLDEQALPPPNRAAQQAKWDTKPKKVMGAK